MAPSYSAVARRDDDTSHGASPTPSPTVASPLKFLSLTQPAFSPLSFVGSELDFISEGRDDSPGLDAMAKGPETRSGAKATTAGTSIISGVVQSLALPRPTAPANGYGLLSPAPTTASLSNISSCSSLSSSPVLIPAPSPLVDEHDSSEEETTRVLLPDSVAKPDPTENFLPLPSATTANSNSRDSLDSDAQSNQSTDPEHPSSFTIVRPKPRSLPSRPQTSASTASAPIVRTSSATSVTIRHPTPGLNTRSGACVGNIAALEATAERLSMTSSIEDAIRNAHDQLKRSDSRRSSILAASVKSVKSQGHENGAEGNPSVQPPIPLSRQSSILETNSAARFGGYSPAGYVMSPNHSLSSRSTRLRAGSKSSATGSTCPPAPNGLLPEVGNGEDFPFMSRHGPGKSSVRSVLSSKSGKMSLPEIAETEPPVTITQEALDEADRIAAAGEERDEDDETIRAGAQQRMSLDPEIDLGLEMDTPQAEVLQPILDNAFIPQQVPELNGEPGPSNSYPRERPTTSGSVRTFDQAQTAFGDFDGVHCDPDLDFDTLPEPEFPDFPPPEPRARPRQPPPPRPTSYFDPETGKQMLYYPARVPAMLNLPPKLSRNSKSATKNLRRSKIMSAMPEAMRESGLWLPDPLDGETGSPLMSLEEGIRGTESKEQLQAELLDTQLDPQLDTQGQMLSDNPTQQPQPFRRPPRLSDTKRQSRMSMLLDGLPSQLRASTFFDQPTALPKIEVKDGSAMATLDSILDAAASAPVNAFTDHAFAGRLGAEVYGPEKKTKKRVSHLRSASKAEALASLDPKKRASLFSLLGGGKRNSEAPDAAANGRRTAMSNHNGLQNLDNARTSGSIHEDMLSPDLEDDGLAPDEDEEVASDDDDGELYHGAPTTLLAELQLRKQQQKLRTRPVHKAYPNGMHSTLLELDAVAEMERKTRRGKRVNLAWEDPDAVADADEDEDDDDVPLGMLFAARAAGNNDISAVAAEVNRPLGLMQRRDLEDNEPLSRRRDRLQGREPVPTAAALAMARPNLAQRQSVLALAPTGAALEQPTGPEPEIEDEPLGDRMRRLKGIEDENPLPRARPVSMAFSAELLSQFGGDDEDRDKEEKNLPKAKAGAGARKPSDKENDPPLPPAASEEEETLGQRRRRLQAEREAREREMGTAAALSALTGVNPNANGNRTGSMDRLSRQRLSMANVLGAHPVARQTSAAAGLLERRREEEAARVAKEQELKMAEFRAMMPSAIPGTGIGTGAVKGGYLGGRFNDGTAGGLGMGVGSEFSGGQIGGGGWNNRGSVAVGGYAMPQGMMAPPVGVNMGMNGGGFTTGNGFSAVNGAGLPMSMSMGMGMGSMGIGMGMGMNPYATYGAMSMPMAAPPGEIDRVERWRQGVMP